MIARLLALATLALTVLGHGHHDEPHDVSLFRRTNLNERHAIQKRCGATLDAIHRRTLARRGFNGPDAPHEYIPRAALCSMTGETTEGPYYVNNELFRDNVTDGQSGVPLTLHVTIMDVETCEISPNVFMEIWSANSTGSYSGFTTSGSGGGGGGPPGNGTGGPPGGGPSGSMSGSMTMPIGGGQPAPTGSDSSTASATIGPFDGADTAGNSMGGGSTATDNLTFQRGVVQADKNGEATIHALVPGWYTGRAVHIHVRVWENSTVASNGSFISSSGILHHTGQLYFKQELIDEIALLAPYSTNNLAYANATRNDEDSIYPYSTAGGYNPDLVTTLLGATLEEGLLGEIVITINSSYVSPSASTAYHVAEGADTGSSSSGTNSTSDGQDVPDSARRRLSSPLLWWL